MNYIGKAREVDRYGKERERERERAVRRVGVNVERAVDG